MGWSWIAVVVGLIAINAVASARVLGAPMATPAQRALQLSLVWLLPVVGAVMCSMFVATDSASAMSSLDPTAFVDNADAGGTPWDAPPGANICGCAGDGGAGGDSD